jgi:hypothetical protein
MALVQLIRGNLLVLCLALLAAPVPTLWAAEDEKPKSKGKEKEKEIEGITWTNLFKLRADTPGSGATWGADKEFKVTERALRFNIKLTSDEGKGGNMTLTLHKLGKPVKKIPVARMNRPGDKEVLLPVEPGDYKLEIVVSNVNATVSVDEGKKK